MKHRSARTIWKPIQASLAGIIDTTAPVIAFFDSIRAVDADASQGLLLKHLRLSLTMGLVHSGTLANDSTVGGFMGLFKWPADAATPTVATIDLGNRTKIFARTLYNVQGDQVSKYSLGAKSVRLTLGEEVWFFLQKSTESNTSITLHMAGQRLHYETQA